jgi:hypothetical protein
LPIGLSKDNPERLIFRHRAGVSPIGRFRRFLNHLVAFPTPQSFSKKECTW